MSKGSLVVVGTGIRTVGQLTMEAVAQMKGAEELLHLLADPASEAIIRELNPDHAVSLRTFYEPGKPRREIYVQITERILASVRAGRRTCAVFYGHPGVFVFPSHRAVQAARAEGFEARMLPAISAADCLYADLGVDPATSGLQVYEATDFLVTRRVVETSAALILWQIGLLADWFYRPAGYDLRALPLLVERLTRDYPSTHPATVYEAALYPGRDPQIDVARIGDLVRMAIRPMATLYVPPLRAPVPDRELWEGLSAMGVARPQS